MERNRRTGDDINARTCKICYKVISRTSDLPRHIQGTHEKIKSHACPYEGCQKSFSQKSALKTHRNTHTGETPYQCDICSAAFRDPSVLARHREEQHLQTKGRFECGFCHYSFKRLDVLRKHIRGQHLKVSLVTSSNRKLTFEGRASQLKRASLARHSHEDDTPRRSATAPISPTHNLHRLPAPCIDLAESFSSPFFPKPSDDASLSLVDTSSPLSTLPSTEMGTADENYHESHQIASVSEHLSVFANLDIIYLDDRRYSFSSILGGSAKVEPLEPGLLC